MDENNEVIILVGLIQVIGFAALGLLIKTSLTSYLNEKGKNLATKEDIQDITKKVEEVKSDFHIQTQAKLSNNLDRKQALISLYEAYHNWFSILVNAQAANIFSVAGIHKLNENIDEAFSDFEYKRAQVEIFYAAEGADFWEFLNSLVIPTSKLDGEYRILLMRLEGYIKREEKIENFNSYEQKFVAEQNEVFEERRESLNEYFKKSLLATQELFPIKLELAKTIKNEISKAE